MKLREGKEIILLNFTSAESFEEADEYVNSSRLAKGRKDDLLGLIHSLICMVEKDSLWMNNDQRLMSEPKMVKSMRLRPIL